MIQSKETEISQVEKFDNLVERIKAILTESVFSARITLLEGKHRIGQEIVDDELYKKWKKGTGDLVKEIEKKIGVGKTEIYLCIKFYQKFPDVSALLERLPGKKNDITWAATKRLLVAPSANKPQKTKRSKYWETMVNILEGQFPKGKCKERGRALVMLSYIEMMLQGWTFNADGKPKAKPLKFKR